MKKSKYDHLIRSSDKPLVLIDFYADWCGPCKALAPSLSKISKEFSDKLSVYKINIDKNQGLAGSLNVRSIPSLFLYRDGKVIWKQVGGMSYSQLKNELSVFTNRT